MTSRQLSNPGIQNTPISAVSSEQSHPIRHEKQDKPVFSEGKVILIAA
jgi:hypothetical protein